MGLRVDDFSAGLKTNNVAVASVEPALWLTRTYVHNCPLFIFVLPGNSTGTGMSSVWSLPSVST
jgi:hypothetical protein